jgi:DNA-directed RNA polymerase subunit K/omega
MEQRKISNNTETRNLAEIASPTGNVYESTMIIAKRANQISATIKQELSHKLEEFTNYADTLEETFENREQIEISKHYERLPKPTLTAIDEFLHGEIHSRKVSEE